MRRTSLFAGALLLGMPLGSLSGQERWNDRASDSWLRDAPRVRVWIDGSRSVHVGTAVRVQFDVSDDAYVVVGRVSSDGRLSILHPRNRNQRPMVGGGMTHTVLEPRTGAPFGFVVNERFSGYVFALASYAPLDLSVLETRDFQRTMGYSTFSLANREFARSPDEYIPRFASMLLWGDDASYDYDVDYYHPYETSRYASALSFCSSRFGGSLFGGYYGTGFSRALFYGYDDWSYGGYQAMCGNYLFSLRCLTYASFYNYGCSILPSRLPRFASRPPVPAPSGDPADVLNGKNIRDFVTRPDTVGRIPGSPGKAPGTEGATTGRRLSEWDGLYSIPTRAVTKLKRQEAGGDATPVRADDLSRFRTIRSEATAPRRTKATATDRGNRAGPARPVRERVATPSRPRDRSTGASSGRSRPLSDAVVPGRQRGTSKPASARPTKQISPSPTKSKPASSTRDKKKPPPQQQ